MLLCEDNIRYGWAVSQALDNNIDIARISHVLQTASNLWHMLPNEGLVNLLSGIQIMSDWIIISLEKKKLCHKIPSAWMISYSRCIFQFLKYMYECEYKAILWGLKSIWIKRFLVRPHFLGISFTRGLSFVLSNVIAKYYTSG